MNDRIRPSGHPAALLGTMLALAGAVLPLLGAVLVLLAAPAFAEPAAPQRDAASLLPQSVVLYAEIPDPKRLVGAVLDHPLRQRVEASEEYRAAMTSPDFLKFRLGVVFLEKQLGADWRTVLASLTDGGVALAYDARTRGAVVLARCDDAAMLEKTRRLLVTVTRNDAHEKKRPDPVKESEHRGVTLYQINQGHFATAGRWLIASNQAALVRDVIDRRAGDGAASLAELAPFVAARKTRPNRPVAWAFLHVETIRNAGLAKQLYAEKPDNPGAEMLLGGVLETLRTTPYATASIGAQEDRLRLSVSVPQQGDSDNQRHKVFFGPGGGGAAPASLRPKGTILQIRAYRRLADLWSAAPDIFDEKGNAQISKSDSDLSTLFGGKQFGSDVLGSLGPEIQLLVAAGGELPADVPKPAIKLPAGAAVFELKKPEVMQRQFKVSFQSIVGFLNIVGGMQGNPPLEMTTETRGPATIVSAKYFVDAPEKKSDAEIYFNFEPTLALVGDRMVVASTRALALELADAIAQDGKKRDSGLGAAESATQVVNTAVQVDIEPLRRALDENRDHLIAQNMLEKGHDRQAAEKEIQSLLKLLSLLRDVSFELVTENRHLRLEATARLADR